jgi:signal transduction histidine kinase
MDSRGLENGLTMLRRPLDWLPATLLAITVATEIASVTLSWGLEARYDTLGYAFYSVILAVAGALVATRRPGNAIGWLFCGTALMNALIADAAQGYGLRAAQRGWPAGPAFEWISGLNWLLGGMGLVLTFLLFPDGRLPGPRWRPVVWIGAVGVALALPGWTLSPDRGNEFVSGHNPLAAPSLPTWPMFAVGFSLFVTAFVASGVALVLRFRRASGVQRQQIKWFAFAAVISVVTLSLSAVLWYVTPLAPIASVLALTALPVAACIAILRYRLYDIDLVINRAVVYGVLTLLLAATYVATTLALGTAVDRSSAWVTACATLFAALAFRPLRVRIQDIVDRRFNRARYEALRQMTDFLEELRAGRAAPEDVEGLLRELVGDPHLELVFLDAAGAHHVDGRGATVPASAIDGRAQTLIERAGQPLGIVLHDGAEGARPRLLPRIIEAGGLAIEIARLRVELRGQLAEVEASRARIVAAGNEERRRMERDLHDGAQQRLVSIGLALRHAQHELGNGAPAAASATLDGAVGEVAVAIDELRELARGLPPSQLDAGLAAAFHELARRAPLPVQVRAASDRFDRGVEAAAYFVGCEALTNAVKHAQATRIVLCAARENGRLVVSVADDGIGGATPVEGSGLSGLADRVAALGGTLSIASDRGAGTTLVAELPCGS